MPFKNKHIVVTGGANGIGRCIAEKFIIAGAFVSVIDSDEQAGLALSSRFAGLTFFYGDISSKDTLEVFAATLTHPVDILINNACLSHKGLISNCGWDDFEYVQRVGVTAPYYLTSLLTQRNLLAEGASIVNISSTRAMQSQADTESYSAAKGGILALTHAMSVSLAGRARVNAVSPGWIETAAYQIDGSEVNHSEADKRQHLVGRVGKPEDISEMVFFLCDNSRAGFITGQNFMVDGGMSKLMVYHDDHGWQFNKNR